jgi:DNA-binding MarR family transcriptional regulator
MVRGPVTAHQHHHRHDPQHDAPPEVTSELAELLSHAARRLRRGSSEQLAPLGLTYGQAKLLRIVACAGQPPRMADIASQLEVVPRSVTTMVDGVEAAGLVVRRPDPDDRRSVLVELTPAGRRLQDRLARARRNSAQVVFGSLGPDDSSELLRLLGVLCERGSCHTCCGGREHRSGATSPRHGDAS